MPADTHKPATFDELDKLRKAAADVRRPNEGQWQLNIAFWRGQQWIMWDGTRLVRLDDDEPLPVDNRIKPIVRKAIAKETKQRPTPEATPASTDDDDIEGAQLAEELVDNLWDKQKLPAKTRTARWWRRMTGAGFIKITWDRTQGDYVDVLVDDQGKPRTDVNGRLMRTDRDDVAAAVQAAAEAGMKLPTTRICMGEISTQVRTPFQVLVDPHATEDGLDSASYIIEEVIQSVEKAKETYPDKAAKITADTHAGATTGGALGLPGLGRKPEGEKTGVIVRELWQKPCADYPDGRRVVWAAKTILADEPNPYGWLPYIMLRGDPNGDTFWPGAPVTDLISPQIRLNKRVAQLDSNADRFGNAALMYPQGMELEYDGTVGEHLQYPATGSPDSVPSYLRPPELPSYVVTEPDRAVGSLQEISGQHEVSSAQVPAGVTAASAISMLLEQDDTQLGPDIEDADTALEEICNRMLELAGDYYDDERAIEIAGEDGDWEIRRFRGSQLLGAGTRYRVKMRTGTPQSKAMKQAAMMQLLDLLLKYGGPQAINPRNLRRYLRDFEIGGLERMTADVDVVERKVARENRRMLRGEQVPVNPWDQHADEIAAHNEERMTIRYERQATANPTAADAFQTHILQHAQFMQMQMQALAPPLPPGSPESVPPGSPVNGGPPAQVPSP